MSTVGHPLSDVCNFMTNFYTAKYDGTAPYDNSAFLPGATPGLPQPDQILKWYAEFSDGWCPSPREVSWGMAAFCTARGQEGALRTKRSYTTRQRKIAVGRSK